MSDCIFTFGKKDKKLLIPLIYLLANIFINIFETEYNIVDTYIENFAMSISEIMGFFLSVIVKHFFKIKLNQETEKQKYLKDFGILFLFAAFYKFNDILPFVLDKLNKAKNNEDEKDIDNSRGLLVNDALELIIISLVTYCTLKYQYYIHHIISIIIIDLICIALDFAFFNFFHTNIYTIISSFVLIFADSFIYSYLKYLIEFKYYYYLDLLYIYGIFCFFWNSVSLGTIILAQKIKGSDSILFEFYDYFRDNGIMMIVIRFLKGLVISGFIMDILEFLILDKLTPNYIIIGYEIGKIPSNIIYFVTTKDYNNFGSSKDLILTAIIVLSILQVIGFLFYLEILEFNFCSLNENTKKNIEERERLLDFNNIFFDNSEIDKESDIAITDYIITDGIRQRDSEISFERGYSTSS